MSDEDKKKKTTDTAVALGQSEIVTRYGSASAEYIVGYRGVNNETGQVLNRGLKSISQGKLHPDFEQANLKQQAGYSAEVASVSRRNAESIIDGSTERYSRADDVAEYGTNHPVYDHVKIKDGDVVPGSGSQMKVVGNPEKQLKRIAEGSGGGRNDHSRYLDTTLDLPSEQVEGAKQFCRERAAQLRRQADRLDELGDTERAGAFRNKANNYDSLEKNIRDAGLTSEEALQYRLNPLRETFKDIATTSHRAGVEGAKYGAAIGGSISLITNLCLCVVEGKDPREAVKDAAIDTGKAAALGYGTAFVGSAIKGTMQQSHSEFARVLSNTSLPALVVSTCLSLSSSIRRLVHGEINGTAFLEEIGENSAGMLASSMMAGLGQIAIPIPVAGALIGGMIGYSLSSMFYQEGLLALKERDAAIERYELIKVQCAIARSEMIRQRKLLEAAINEHLGQKQTQVGRFFHSIDEALEKGDVDAFARAVNRFAEALGRKLEFEDLVEFNEFMDSSHNLTL